MARRLISFFIAAAGLLYPVAIYFALTRFETRTIALVALALALPIVLFRLRSARREDLAAVLPAPLSVALLMALAAVFGDARLILALPVLISVALLVVFGRTLTQPVSMIERFARLTDPELSLPKQHYCRTVTIVWCGFFIVNAAIAGFLAVQGPRAAWALYTGLLAYVAIGILFAVEYVVRKVRFRDYGAGIQDRLIAWVFPPRAS